MYEIKKKIKSEGLFAIAICHTIVIQIEEENPDELIYNVNKFYLLINLLNYIRPLPQMN